MSDANSRATKGKKSRLKTTKGNQHQHVADVQDNGLLVTALRVVDPIMQLLTRSSGRPLLALETLLKAVPMSQIDEKGKSLKLVDSIYGLARRHIFDLFDQDENCISVESLDLLGGRADCFKIGFNAISSSPKGKVLSDAKRLGASTKTSAKRRLTSLRASLKKQRFIFEKNPKEGGSPTDTMPACEMEGPAANIECSSSHMNAVMILDPVDSLSKSEEAQNVVQGTGKVEEALYSLLNIQKDDERRSYRAAAYAGKQYARTTNCSWLPDRYMSQVPKEVSDVLQMQMFKPRADVTRLDLHLDSSNIDEIFSPRKLFSHQVKAVTSILDSKHTMICTSTGSGKSMCYIIPILVSAIQASDTEKSILIFPTKALAQDQLGKLVSLSQSLSARHEKVLLRPACIDGDIPHQQREDIAREANVILTNPDTLHAAILPTAGSRKKSGYRDLLAKVRYIVLDESHTYEGSFGAHVSLVFSRLIRLCSICQASLFESGTVSFKMPTFIACSATLEEPEKHFRSIVRPICDGEAVVVSANDDGSPCGAKHFFVWNPPLHMNSAGYNDCEVSHDPIFSETQSESNTNCIITVPNTQDVSLPTEKKNNRARSASIRKHPADETAHILASAIKNNVRCIAFCKTRNLVEWVYDKCVAELRRDSATLHLVQKVESYRGGYSREARRGIERKLFCGDLLGVVGTCALELGVDIGGIDLTLHCGYPGSFNNLVQQAGRAGRGGKSNEESFAVMICFKSPAEQHLWRHPSGLLSRGPAAGSTLPLDTAIVIGHLLCASFESPLTGSRAALCIIDSNRQNTPDHLSDNYLFGGNAPYEDALETLKIRGCVCEEKIYVGAGTKMTVFRCHTSHSKPYAMMSMRSIEPITYGIVDITHPLQGGQVDYIRNDKAVIDSIPYSRVFYHAFPGSIIMHRGKKFIVLSLQNPPAVLDLMSDYGRSDKLAAFVKPTQARYHTRALSKLIITVVKQFECIQVDVSTDEKGKKQERCPQIVLAGNGAVTVKRKVWGYSKLSLVNRSEISRSEISLPPMEYDTNAFWLETQMWSDLKYFGYGNHALSHAILAVAPLFVPGASTDLDCDHSFIDCSRILIFDLSPGGGSKCSQLLFQKIMRNGDVLGAAVDLLSQCAPCNSDEGYIGGCPNCIHNSRCIKFNEGLSRQAGIVLGKKILSCMNENLYKQDSLENNTSSISKSNEGTPRKRARRLANTNGRDLVQARSRHIVVGRPSWPTDNINENF